MPPAGEGGPLCCWMVLPHTDPFCTSHLILRIPLSFFSVPQGPENFVSSVVADLEDQPPVSTRVNKEIHECSDNLGKFPVYRKVRLFLSEGEKRNTDSF